MLNDTVKIGVGILVRLYGYLREYAYTYSLLKILKVSDFTINDSSALRSFSFHHCKQAKVLYIILDLEKMPYSKVSGAITTVEKVFLKTIFHALSKFFCLELVWRRLACSWTEHVIENGSVRLLQVRCVECKLFLKDSAVPMTTKRWKNRITNKF